MTLSEIGNYSINNVSKHGTNKEVVLVVVAIAEVVVLMVAVLVLVAVVEVVFIGRNYTRGEVRKCNAYNYWKKVSCKGSIKIHTHLSNRTLYVVCVIQYQ